MIVSFEILDNTGIADELLLKLAIRVSPRTVRKNMPKRPDGQPRGDQRWSTFLKNHAKAIVACDFFVAVTATFRLLYVFVVIEHGSRRLVRVDVTAYPSAAWTLQQLRDVVGVGHAHRLWSAKIGSGVGWLTGPRSSMA
jgi:putative transposase